MKILAISDWRIQPMSIITDLITTHQPDLLLYAGDDVQRIVRPIQLYVPRTSTSLVRIDENLLSKCPCLGDKVSRSAANPVRHSEDGRAFWMPTNTPVLYVPGNDEVDAGDHSRVFIPFHNYHLASDNEWRRLCRRVKSLTGAKSMVAQAYRSTELKLRRPLPAEMARHVLMEIRPLSGIGAVGPEGDQISVWGSRCTCGLQSRVVDPPKGYADIYLSHVPPLGALDLSTRFGVEHIGDRRLREAVERFSPRVVVCGHSHFWGGYKARISNTAVVNVSSNDNIGYEETASYAIIDTGTWSVKSDVYSRGRTRSGVRGFSALASNIRDVMFSGGVPDGVFTELLKLRHDLCSYRRSGVPDLEQFIGRLTRFKVYGLKVERVIERLRSRARDAPEQIRPITKIPGHFAFCDVETGLIRRAQPGQLWLIGLLVGDEIIQFDWRREKRQFIRALRDLGITKLVCWTQYDGKVLGPEIRSRGVTVKFLDFCQRVSNCVVWHTYALEELYRALVGDEISSETIEGRVAGILADHLILSRKRCDYCSTREEIEGLVREKNRLDLLRMRAIYRKLRR